MRKQRIHAPEACYKATSEFARPRSAEMFFFFSSAGNAHASTWRASESAWARRARGSSWRARADAHALLRHRGHLLRIRALPRPARTPALVLAGRASLPTERFFQVFLPRGGRQGLMLRMDIGSVSHGHFTGNDVQATSIQSISKPRQTAKQARQLEVRALSASEEASGALLYF